MGDRGRGRASRGRARGGSAQGGVPQPGAPRPGPPSQQGQQSVGGRPGPAQPPGGVWAGRATALPQQQAAPPSWGVRAPAPDAVQSVGRGSRPRPGEERSAPTIEPQQG